MTAVALPPPLPVGASLVCTRVLTWGRAAGNRALAARAALAAASAMAKPSSTVGGSHATSSAAMALGVESPAAFTWPLAVPLPLLLCMVTTATWPCTRACRSPAYKRVAIHAPYKLERSYIWEHMQRGVGVQICGEPRERCTEI